MQVQPASAYHRRFLDDSKLTEVAQLVNTGSLPLHNISVQLRGFGPPLTSLIVKPSNITVSNTVFLSELAAGQSMPFDIVLDASGSVRGRIGIIFTSQSGTVTIYWLNLRVDVRTPLLRANPDYLSASVNRGEQKSFEIDISNEGIISARDVRVELSGDPLISLISFSPESDNSTVNQDGTFTIPASTKARLSLSITVPPTESIGDRHGSMIVRSKLTEVVIRYKILITSSNKVDLMIRVEDEYTYYTDGDPLVVGAKVKLKNPQKGNVIETYTTSNSTELLFDDLEEAYYNLQVSADRHTSYSAVILASPANPNVTVFLQRTAVKYSWTVTPVTYQDKYIITLDSTFETEVPMPVVTIEPRQIDLTALEEGEKNEIVFTITNHGLIRAENLRFALPNNHPTLEFIQTVPNIGDIEANTTLIVPVEVREKPRQKRNFLLCLAFGIKLFWDYLCGVLRTSDIDVMLQRRQEMSRIPPNVCGGGGGPVGGGGGYIGGGPGGSTVSTSVRNYEAVTPMSCDCAKKLILDCLLPMVPGFGPIYSIGRKTYALGSAIAGKKRKRRDLNGDILYVDDHSYPLTRLKRKKRYIPKEVDAAASFSSKYGCLKAIGEATGESLAGESLGNSALKIGGGCLPGPAGQAVGCLHIIIAECPKLNAAAAAGSGNRKRRSTTTIQDVYVNMATVNSIVYDMYQLSFHMYGSEEMFNIGLGLWYQEFEKSISDNSDLGTSLSLNESANVLQYINETDHALVSEFLQRWNNSVNSWRNGVTEPSPNLDIISKSMLETTMKKFTAEHNKSVERGFDNVFAEFDNAYIAVRDNFENAKKEEGVCARVRIRIVQEAVLTRDAFNGKLEIENGENSALTNIKVELHIFKSEDVTQEHMIEHFAIGDPDLNGISAVDGSGSLAKGKSGSAEWLIIPYSTAAPTEDVLYDIGGVLTYFVDGANFTAPLLADSVTVKPDPRLHIHYFHEKYVEADDPFTKDVVEPSIPFSLAVMITNTGNGMAKEFKITSAQPEIIENEKGLLVSFKIIAAQLGNEDISPSLTIDFGDIEPHQTKTARWLLECSLKGKFFNYTATFENINPLGDPELSVLDVLEYHDLIHLVRMRSNITQTDDGFRDFLVNDELDGLDMPDVVYNSKGQSKEPVFVSLNVTYERANKHRSSKEYKYIYVNVPLNWNCTDWLYSRFEHDIELDDGNQLLQVTRHDGKELIRPENAWMTWHIEDSLFGHLFDHCPWALDLLFHNYTFIVGPLNKHDPKVNESITSFEVKLPIYDKHYISTIVATDEDGDGIKFSLLEHSDYFQIDSNSGVITAVQDIDSLVGKQTIHVGVEDDGIPSRKSISVINVIFEAADTTTKTMTSHHTAETTSATIHTELTTSTSATNITTTTREHTVENTDGINHTEHTTLTDSNTHATTTSHTDNTTDGITHTERTPMISTINNTAMTPEHTVETTDEITHTDQTSTDIHSNSTYSAPTVHGSTFEETYSTTPGTTIPMKPTVTSGSSTPSKNSGLLSLLLTLNMLWKAVFSNVNASETSSLTDLILRLLYDAFQGVPNILKVIIDNLSPGSVIVKLGILLTEKADNKTANQTCDILKKYLETVNYTIVGEKENITIKNDSLVVNINPCQDIDCGGNGECVSEDQKTTCKCNPGYMGSHCGDSTVGESTNTIIIIVCVAVGAVCVIGIIAACYCAMQRRKRVKSTSYNDDDKDMSVFGYNSTMLAKQHTSKSSPNPTESRSSWMGGL